MRRAILRKGRSPILEPTGQQMKLLGSVDMDIRACGLTIPFLIDVVQGLTFDAILGADFLAFTRAKIDSVKSC